MIRRLDVRDISRLCNKVDILSMKVDSITSSEERCINKIMKKIDKIEDTLKGNSNLLSSEEAAEHLGVPISQIYKWTKTKSLPYYRPGKKYYFDRYKLDEWVRNNM